MSPGFAQVISGVVWDAVTVNVVEAVFVPSVADTVYDPADRLGTMKVQLGIFPPVFVLQGLGLVESVTKLNFKVIEVLPAKAPPDPAPLVTVIVVPTDPDDGLKEIVASVNVPLSVTMLPSEARLDAV